MYPKASMVKISTSTNVVCAKCKQPTGIWEDIFRDEHRDVFYHAHCVSGETEKAETKIVSLQLTDDLNVKSEGR